MQQLNYWGFKLKRLAIYSLIVVGIILVLAVFWAIFGKAISPLNTSNSLMIDSTDEMAFDTGLSNAPTASKTNAMPTVDRNVITTINLELKVEDATVAVGQIQTTAVSLGGFTQQAEIKKVDEVTNAAFITIRVPAAQLEEALTQVRQTAIKVESERLDQTDVTEQTADLSARLTNAKAEEQQYLSVLKTAKTVDEVLQVTEKLSATRERIELLSSQIQLLENQVKLATITAQLVEQSDIEIFGIEWRPLFEIKKSFRNLLDNLVAYLNGIIAVVFALPTILLWIFSVVVIIHYGWKLVLWLYRTFLRG